ncbi:MAG: ribosome maturation protein RimP [Novosphingobium sp.]
MADIARIVEMVEPEARALGFDLVRVKIFGKSEAGGGISEAGYDERALQIMAERPDTGQLVIDDCAALSRRISDKIDELELKGIELIEGAYRLEVSSPGIDRPLTRPMDFANWAGHEARVQLAAPVEGNRKTLQGDLAGIAGEPGSELVTLEDKKSGTVQFALADVISAKLVLTDRLIAATRPLDTSGVDDILEDRAEKWEPVFGFSDPTDTNPEQED